VQHWVVWLVNCYHHCYHRYPHDHSRCPRLMGQALSLLPSVKRTTHFIWSYTSDPYGIKIKVYNRHWVQYYFHIVHNWPRICGERTPGEPENQLARDVLRQILLEVPHRRSCDFAVRRCDLYTLWVMGLNPRKVNSGGRKGIHP